MSRNRIVSALALAVVPFGVLAITAAPASAAGVSGPAFYVDHQLYRTVGTPTDLSGTGAPASSFDAIYAFADQRSVAEAAPGDRGFNGGRWQVHSVVVDDYAAALEAGDLDGNGVLDALDEVQAALDSGHARDDGIIKEFVCTVNKLPAGQR